jgi:hypothetical protein
MLRARPLLVGSKSTSRALPILLLFGPESLRKLSGLGRVETEIPECRPETPRYRLAFDGQHIN